MDNEEKYFCRNCNGLRNHNFLFEKKLRGSDEGDYFHWIDKYYLIECKGCETLSFLNIYSNSEMYSVDEEGNQVYYQNTNVFPLHLTNGHELSHLYLLPPTIRSIYEETIISIKANAYILAAGGLRAIIEAICNNLKLKKTDLSKRIDLLHEKGFLTVNESKRLHSIRFLGNDALHEIKKPQTNQIYGLLEIVNHLLENLFITDKKIDRNIDKLIDKYEDFLRLLKSKTDKDLVNQELNLKKILGKSLRLFRQNDLKQFESKLIESIKAGKIDFLEIKNSTSPVIYKIIKTTDSIFDQF